MNKLVRLLIVVCTALMVVSCSNDSIYKGFKRMPNGAYMKFYSKSDSEVMPQYGDGVTFEMAQYFDDSLYFTTAGDEPIEIVLERPAFVGDVMDALVMMHIGDSARAVVLSDSVFMAMLGVEAPDEYLGKPIYYDLKLLSVKPAEEIEVERRAVLDSLKRTEEELLEPLRNNHWVTESGLIIMENDSVGRIASLGEYIDLDFLMCSLDGDTIMSSFGVESVQIQYGEEFISAGFNEAIGMLAKGGTMRFVMPSSLGFDSVGYQQVIHPYMPLMVEIRMNDVMSSDEYEQMQTAKIERQQAVETEKIVKYLKDNDITVEPTESGLYIVVDETGEGPIAQWGEKVAIHYVMSNLDGVQLESTYDYEEPVTFTIGQGEMLLCIEEAVMTMNAGSLVHLITPSALAFGDYEADPELLPAYSPMVIDLELVAIEE